MKTLLLFITLLFCSFPSYSQLKFQKTYGTPLADGASGVPTVDGGYIMCGDMRNGANTIIQDCIMKTDSIGSSIWTKTYESSDTNLRANLCVVPSKDGGYFISDYFFIGGIGGQYDHPCLIKTDSNGDTVWVRRVDPGRVIHENADGTYTIMNGMHMLWKVDSGFNTILWGKSYVGYSQTKWMESTIDGGYILYGDSPVWAAGGNGDWDLYIVKTDSGGTVQWSHSYGTTNTEYLAWGTKCIQQTTDLGYVFTGTSDVNGKPEILVVKIDANGNLQWSKTYGGGSGCLGLSIRQVAGGIGYILGGITTGVEVPQNGNRTMIVRLDGMGNKMWGKMYGSIAANPIESDWAGFVENAYDGGFVLSGGTQSMGAGDWDGWLVKTDANGVSGCNEVGTSPIVSVSNIIVGGGGADSTETPGIITNEGPLVIGIWSIPDSMQCPPPSNPGVHEYDLENLISLYPNPTSGVFTITTEQLAIKNIEVINVLGEKVYWLHDAHILNHSGTIDLSSQPDGIYFVRVQTEKGIMSKKMMVIK